MIDWITLEASGHYFFFAFPVCILILLMLLKGCRIKFLIPSILITLVIVNPWFYDKWTEIGLYAYWRVLWIVPVIPVVAALVPAITEKSMLIVTNEELVPHKCLLLEIGRIGIAAIGVTGIVLGGSFIYQTKSGIFTGTQNIEKLPGYIVEIADRLLELEEHPRVIAQDPVGVYIRQYTGEIDTLFGRDFHGYILWPSQDAKIIYNAISISDFDTISQYMLDEKYDYAVLSSEVDNETLELVDKVGEYGIYKALGHPNVIKERNELGQVIAVTTVGENGEPVCGDRGYSTVSYEYDNNGFIAREIYSNWNRTDLRTEKHIFGYERTYDQVGHVLMERTLGQDGKPMAFYRNYAEVRYEYKGDKIVKTSYYDENGVPAEQEAGYAAVLQEWDGEKLIRKTYLNADGEIHNRKDGYAVADWMNGDTVFYDKTGNKIDNHGLNLFKNIKVNLDGWTNWMTPAIGASNYTYSIGFIDLGENETGDNYSCQIEIEFKDVKAIEGNPFLFCTQGTVDGQWDVGNIWAHYIWLTEAPKNGIYKYSTTETIDSDMADAHSFEIGFRCDNWESGSFRVRNIKIEKNAVPTEWSSGI